MSESMWQPLLPSDLPFVDALADLVHITLQERPEVFAERLRLFPEGCKKLVLGSKIVGYGISHPWMTCSVPALDSMLESLPPSPNCIYVHDIVVSTDARGKGASQAYVQQIKSLATSMGIKYLALVSVYGTEVLWKRFGFKKFKSAMKELETYGPFAKYMILHI
jgi:GNAT superfamily N-acetyltransferase